MSVAIRFENVGKLYRLGTVGTGTLSHDIRRWWITSVMHKEDPYLKIGETNDRSTKGSSDYVYALKDINLEVKEGDVLGIIGKNGAGKSTLLKLLSRVTAPTTGKICIKGRIASLLEVGTGFHPELTGRENIYMNGCILGMKKWEIDKKLDEIVDFSGCERYLDTPVKRYSSGMMVRLGFAVAAHLEPEILVVDEVLAVGDAEFQKKAIGKMQDVSKGEGRTVLFVSHNMASIKQLCNNSVLLSNGLIDAVGETSEIVNKYIQSNVSFVSQDLSQGDRQGSGVVKFNKVYVTNDKGDVVDTVLTGQRVTFNFELYATKESEIDIGFSFFTPDNTMISNLYSSFQGRYFQLSAGITTIQCQVDNFSFCSPILYIRGVINVKGQLADWPKNHLLMLRIEKGNYYKTGALSEDNNLFLFAGLWSLK